jgi:asparagine synthase (glutamine-hydrolysing)
MCGIAGKINLDNTTATESDIIEMMCQIKHRGPDDEGIFIENSIGLGFVRLSILDLSAAGHQPMYSADNDLVIIFNGEIFNYIELREELKEKGHEFKTQTDTEVLLNAYKEWGKECQHKFNGMWAFVIYDKTKNSLFISRDRYGIKPFYYTIQDNTFYFASEIPAILKVIRSKPRANNQAIFDFLVFNRTDQSEKTFFENVFKLKHGHCISIDLNKNTDHVTINNWYNLKSNLKEAVRSKEEYFSLFKDAVELRMRSDVPVGVCLSGGLDSSSILSTLLKDNKHSDINTFSAIYNKGDKGDESEFINLYKTQVKNMHFITPDADALYKDLNDFVKAHGEPIPSTSAYAQYRVMGLAKGKVTVTLDGQGADEQLAGYHYFFGLYYKELFLKLKWGKLIKEIIEYYKQHKSFFALKTFIFFLLPKKRRTKLRVSEKGYLNSLFNASFNTKNNIAGNLYGSSNLREALLDHFEYKMEHHLKWGDYNSMWHSIESRMPFLDHRLVERTISLPSDWIIKNGTTKHILREAMTGTLPEQIRNRRDKVGFATPEGEWFRNEPFKGLIESILNSQSFANRKIIDPNKAKALYAKHLNKKIDISKEIWKWIHLELWFREFIDDKSISPKVCIKGIWNDLIPAIKFDSSGISNYYYLQEKMMKDYPRGEKGKKEWESIIGKMKISKGNGKYDCVIGVSGGVDSSYLLHLSKQFGLNPLAVHLDNGFNSEIAVNNIEKITKTLNIDLVTHVINYEEIKDLLKSYMKAGLPWIDFPTDLAIKATMYNVAFKHNIKFILRGNDFRSEGKQPTEWTYSDTKQLNFIHKNFGNNIALKTYPLLSLSKMLYAGTVKKIKDIRPYYYLDYSKESAKSTLMNMYQWKDYGGHHHENLFTKFAMAYWLPKKFGIDKRCINLSAQIISGSITREKALKKISEPFDTTEELEKLKVFVIKKLGLTETEFDMLMKTPNKTFKDYPSDYRLVYDNIQHFKWFIKRLYGFKPMSIDSKEFIDT